MGPKQVRIVVRGRVQGVCFRATTQSEALRLGLTGWVRNCPDGSVEILAQGPEKPLNELARWAHQGPRAARVDQVDIKWDDATGHFDAFRVVNFYLS
ncbi:MAG TPA: acylphosphatase [Polyangium sp.]|nr:acylphosphatase [Polyangium sp.]